MVIRKGFLPMIFVTLASSLGFADCKDFRPRTVTCQIDVRDDSKRETVYSQKKSYQTSNEDDGKIEFFFDKIAIPQISATIFMNGRLTGIDCQDTKGEARLSQEIEVDGINVSSTHQFLDDLVLSHINLSNRDKAYRFYISCQK